nr:MAG TPA: hypothetical protein [Caudoviricetes sp.]
MDEITTTAELGGAGITEADLAAFDTDWNETAPDEDDFDLSDDTSDAESDTEDAAESEDTGSEEDTTTEEPAESETPEKEDEQTETEEQQEEKGHQLYTLKTPKGEKQCSLDEVLVYANKGMDYDGMRQDRDRLRDFLKEMAAPLNLSVEELIDNTRARMLIQQKKEAGEELSEMEALTIIQRNRAEKQAEAQATDEKAANEAAKAQMIRAFVNEFPDVKATDIPADVWAECNRTGDLAGAYRKYADGLKDSEIKRLKKENETLKQNQKNKDRSTGPRRSAGAATPKDPFDEAWDSF